MVDSLGGFLDKERQRRSGVGKEILELLPYEVDALKEKGGEKEVGPGVDLSVLSGDSELEACDFSRQTIASKSDD